MHPLFAKTMKRTAVGLLLLIAAGERSTVKKHLPQSIERGLGSPIATSWTHSPSK